MSKKRGVGAAAFQDCVSLGGSTVDNEVGIFKKVSG